ncbi:MAG: TetR family transcriptional regulator [Gammaproteobacteria bacterium]|jgi:TetR/AcrR family transcriptional regulator, transcriptional repressor for nem operon
MARPAQFERSEVLEKAMQAFWDQGYCATSMADLVEATHLKPGSLYAAFQSKEGLFLASLDHYATQSAARVKKALAEAASPLAGLRGYFRQLAEEVEHPGARRSCLLVNTVLELSRQNPAVQERVNRHLGTIEGLFRDSLEAAQAKGELAPDKDPAALAAFLMTTLWGLRVLTGTAPTQKRAQAIVTQLLSVLD